MPPAACFALRSSLPTKPHAAAQLPTLLAGNPRSAVLAAFRLRLPAAGLGLRGAAAVAPRRGLGMLHAVV